MTPFTVASELAHFVLDRLLRIKALRPFSIASWRPAAEAQGSRPAAGCPPLKPDVARAAHTTMTQFHGGQVATCCVIPKEVLPAAPPGRTGDVDSPMTKPPDAVRFVSRGSTTPAPRVIQGLSADEEVPFRCTPVPAAMNPRDLDKWRTNGL